ncbi:MAG: hypothetical protein HY362_02375 [Candidatus Aenigmarchaeota archaeon]|nr:hypothetical protein [Candidatus Aenigmarchaeota archaeon]
MAVKHYKGKTSKLLIVTAICILVFVAAAYSIGIESIQDSSTGSPTGDVIKNEPDISTPAAENTIETTTTTQKALKSGFKISVIDSKLSINPGEAGYVKFLVEPDEVYEGNIKSYINHNFTPDNGVWGIKVLSIPGETSLPAEITAIFNTTIGVVAGRYNATVKFVGNGQENEFPVEFYIEPQRRDKSFTVCKSDRCDFTEISDAFKAIPNAWVTVTDEGVYEGEIDIAGSYPRLDCGNSLIKGSGKYGIRIRSANGPDLDSKGPSLRATIIDCNIGGEFENGILIENSEMLLLNNIKIINSQNAFEVKGSQNIWLKEFYVQNTNGLFVISDSSYIDCIGRVFIPGYKTADGVTSYPLTCSDDILKGTAYDKNSYDSAEMYRAAFREQYKTVTSNVTDLGSNKDWGTAKTYNTNTGRQESCTTYYVSWNPYFPDVKHAYTLCWSPGKGTYYK